MSPPSSNRPKTLLDCGRQQQLREAAAVLLVFRGTTNMPTMRGLASPSQRLLEVTAYRSPARRYSTLSALSSGEGAAAGPDPHGG